MKLQREISAGVAIPIVAAVLWFAPPWAFGMLVAILGLATLREFCRLAEAAGLPIPKWLVLLPAAGVLAAAAIPAVSPSGVVVAGGVFFLAALFSAAELVSDAPLPLSLAGAGASLLGIALVVLPFCGLMWLDRAYLPGASEKFGARLVFFLFATIWSCDSFAYYVGRRFGKHKLAPEVSPKKTVEGAVGGLIGSVLVAPIVSMVFLPEFRPVEAALVGGLASSAGQLGDLVESMFKRAAGVKDSGVFLPGHGGFYDRVDSLLFAVPVLCGAVLLKMAP
ncbi:MAG: phosphatidate cytidylyltransferase [Thermoanaerobaculia bacterium]